MEPFEGDCWPGNSVWVDFLNKEAVFFWKSLYNYDSFKGTTKLFNFWIDMNEPSVFSGDELTMTKLAVHMTSEGKTYLHRDLHNAYGTLMAKATFEGVRERNEE